MMKKELIDVIDNYDFKRMSPINNRKTFCSILESYQDYQSVTINIAVSAAKFNISNLKKDSEIFLKENIPEDRISGLRDLEISISDKNREYSLGPLSLKKKKLIRNC